MSNLMISFRNLPIKVNLFTCTTFVLTKTKFMMSGVDNYKLRTESKDQHLFDRSELNVYDKKIINLGVGAPGPDLLSKCCDMFQKATEHRMLKELSNNSLLFQYGPTSGIPEIRKELANYLSNVYKNQVYKEDIVITTGATNGLHLILSTLIEMNGVIFVDEVTYFIALSIFKQFSNMTIVPVKLNDDGVDIEYLCQMLSKHKRASEEKLFWGCYYTIPTFHNPTGILFSNDVCESLLNIARKYEILIVCDDVYNNLRYNDDIQPKRLYEYDCIEDDDYKGNVISNGSFSKTVGPGVRLGWMEAPPRCKSLLDKSGVLVSGGCTNNYTSGIMASLFQLNLVQTHISMMVQTYRERMNAVCEVLRCNLPKSCDFHEPCGGYFIWIKLPSSTNANELLEYCIENYKVSFIVGSRFSIKQNFSNCFRITIAFHSKDVLVVAVKNVCSAVKNFLKNQD